MNKPTGIIWGINDQETRLSPWVWQGRVCIVMFWWWNVKGKIKRICQITETDKGLKRVKIKDSDNKRIGDQIKIENL